MAIAWLFMITSAVPTIKPPDPTSCAKTAYRNPGTLPNHYSLVNTDIDRQSHHTALILSPAVLTTQTNTGTRK